MTNPLTGMPYTRRELREQGSAPAAPYVAPETNSSGAGTSFIAAPAQPPVTPVETPTVVASPPPLSRRDRRLLEDTTGDAPPPVVDPSPLVEVLPTPPPATLPASTAPQGPVVYDSEPLPPVFAPRATPQFLPESEDSAAVPSHVSRGVGDMLLTTSSLILPHSPRLDLAGPLGDTGEVVITGQIAVPQQFSAQGTAPYRLDDDDDDQVLDAYITGQVSALSKPISASRAVSGRTKDTEIMSLRKTRWGTGTVVTMLVFLTLGVAAIALAILSLATGVLL